MIGTQHIYLPERNLLACKRQRSSGFDILLQVFVLEAGILSEKEPGDVSEQAQLGTLGLQPIATITVPQIDDILGQERISGPRKRACERCLSAARQSKKCDSSLCPTAAILQSDRTAMEEQAAAVIAEDWLDRVMIQVHNRLRVAFRHRPAGYGKKAVVT
ncbi:hypothetical protein [Erythrobacter aurantius]|uniref:hypothetical protein n=1 Tax=Erythrobacter aurantius TaxID=2909249 RepID=UPI00207A870E|nr:hypothetical protein [Erythrobacter aurantius]